MSKIEVKWLPVGDFEVYIITRGICHVFSLSGFKVFVQLISIQIFVMMSETETKWSPVALFELHFCEISVRFYILLLNDGPSTTF